MVKVYLVARARFAQVMSILSGGCMCLFSG